MLRRVLLRPVSKIALKRRYVGNAAFAAAYKESLANPEQFWKEAAKDIHWIKPFDAVIDDSQSPFTKWFVGGELNTCFNALDRHVLQGRGSHTALIFDSPVTSTIKKITYQELLSDVMQFAGGLDALGIRAGDRVIIYMPMIPDTLVAMLACARLGAVHSVVFGGFPPHELAVRVNDCQPKLLITASCGIDGKKLIQYKDMVDAALAQCKHRVDHCIVLQRPQHTVSLSGTDLDWSAVMQAAQPYLQCTAVKSDHPLYIIYTSGTTGKPKGVVRDTAGHAVALAWTMKHFYHLQQKDVFWTASDVGWVVGHSYSVYGPLIHGCTSVIYEGKPDTTPDASAFWRVIATHNVATLFTAPTAIRAIKRSDRQGKLLRPMPSLRAIFLAGERADTDTIQWLERAVGVPVRDHWWQTETGWPICGNSLGLDGTLPIKYGSVFRALPGYDLRVLDDEGKEVPSGKTGNLVVKLPLPPGTLQTLYRRDDLFITSYMKQFPGYYTTGDAGIIDSDGYTFVMTRTDDIINVAGHRLSTGLMEEVLASHKDVADVAVIGINDKLKGQVPVGFVVLNAGSTTSHEQLQNEIVQLVRENVGAIACFRRIVCVAKLPKTRSGKIVRSTMRKIANGESYTVPGTLEDEGVLRDMETVLRAVAEEIGGSEM